MIPPKPQYAVAPDGVQIAYQVTGRSDIEFEDRGAHALKGVPGEWRLFAAKG